MPGLEPWRERGDDERGETLFHASQPGETAPPTGSPATLAKTMLTCIYEQNIYKIILYF